jgi:hypothetical protein
MGTLALMGRMRNWNTLVEYRKGIEFFGDFLVDGRIILKRILKKFDVNVVIDLRVPQKTVNLLTSSVTTSSCFTNLGS